MHRHVAAGVVSSLLANNPNFRGLIGQSEGGGSNTSHHRHHNGTNLDSLGLAASLLSRDENKNASISEAANNLLLDGSGGQTNRSHRSRSGDYSADSEWVSSHGGELSGSWDADIGYPPILLGHYTARHRHDMDKQEVLAQIQDLDQTDMVPIISSCQFSLCIFYARTILLRSMTIGFQEWFEVASFTETGEGSTGENLRDPLTPDVKQSFQNWNSILTAEIVGAVPSDVLIRFMILSFRQYVSCAPQPDRLLPCMANGNLIGDLRDRVPFVEPFHSADNLWGLLYPLLGAMELHFFRHSVSNLTVEESSVQGIRAMRLFLKSVVRRATDYHTSRFPSDSSEIDSSNGADCGKLLNAIIETCIACIEEACATANDGKDWISSVLDREDAYLPELSGKSLKGKDSAVYGPHSHPVLWAYTVLRILLMHSDKGITQSMSRSLTSSAILGLPDGGSLKSDSNWANYDPFAVLTSPNTLNRLLKASATSNRSIKFCTLDVCSLILARVNMLLFAHGTTHDSQSKTDDGPEPVEDTEYLTMKLSSEYLVSVSREKRLLQMFGSRLRLETTRRVLYSRYTRTMAAFLLQWQMMRRVLKIGNENAASKGTSANSGCSENVVNKYITSHWNQATPANVLAPLERPEVEVIQITSNSITIHWWLHDTRFSSSVSGEPKGLSVTEGPYQAAGGFAIYVTQASKLGLDSTILVRANIEMRGSHRIDNLDPDTLYKVSVVRAPLFGSPAELLSSPQKLLKQSSSSSVFNLQEHNPIPDLMNRPQFPFDALSSALSSACASPVDHIVGDLSTLQELSVLASTESEATFTLDCSSLSPNLVVSNNSLTLRNATNKKWSTARGAVKMCSGLHKWDIHIDRCVSKNIFIGISTLEGKLDNYVGCDRFGWGFLANRAVWHNKSKYKNFGELFRSGDTVSVILDLDVGTLTFILNGVDLGVAVDGLVGPFYPAFSLYNEDDQLSLLPPRSPLESITWSAGVAERVLDRLDSLQELAAYFHNCYKSFTSNSSSFHSASKVTHDGNRDVGKLFSLSSSVTGELSSRLVLWLSGIGIRSLLWKNDFVSIVSSRALCARICSDHYNAFSPTSSTNHRNVACIGPGDVVTVDGVSGRVLGVANHRLWMEMNISGEVHAYCKDSFNVMVASGTIVLIAESQHKEEKVQFQSLPPISTKASSVSSEGELLAVNHFAEGSFNGEGVDKSNDANHQKQHPPAQLCRQAVGGCLSSIDSTVSATLGHNDRMLAASGDNDGLDGDLEDDGDVSNVVDALSLDGNVQSQKLSSTYLSGTIKATPEILLSLSKYKVNVRKCRKLDILRALLLQQLQWSMHDDSVLVEWMDVVMSANYVHPTYLSLTVALKSRRRLVSRVGSGLAANVCGSPSGSARQNTDIARYFGCFLSKYTEDDITFRMLMILHLNDIVLPLLPLISLDDNQTPSNHVTCLLLGMKHLLLHKVKCQFSQTVLQVKPDHVPIFALTNFKGSCSGPDSDNVNTTGDDKLVLFITDESVMRRSIWLAAKRGNMENGQLTCDTPLGPSLLLRSHNCWRLISAFQASYAGQLFEYLESLSSAKYSFPGEQSFSGADNGSLWENILRASASPAISLLAKHCEACFMSAGVYLEEGHIAYADCAEDFTVPFIIRAKTRPLTEDLVQGVFVYAESDPDFTELLKLKESATTISERFIFELYLEKAFLQIEKLIHSIFTLEDDAVDTPGSASADSSCLLRCLQREVTSSTVKVINSLKAGDVNIVLQIMHVVGTLTGIKIRYSFAASIRLPSLFICLMRSEAFAPASEIMVQTEQVLLGLFGDLGAQSSVEDAVMCTETRLAYQFCVSVCLAVRHGINSIVPEVNIFISCCFFL
jgi:hypothetical protein